MADKDETRVRAAAAPDESFLQRWSRRKQTAQNLPDAGPPREPAQTQAGPALTQAAEQPQAPTDEDMPPLDSLGPGSDLSCFFSSGVSEGLRKAALQRLFHQPQYNVTDGLDVYCKDYRSCKPLGDVFTADMRHRLDVARERLARLTEDPEAEADDETQQARSVQADGEQLQDESDEPDGTA